MSENEVYVCTYKRFEQNKFLNFTPKDLAHFRTSKPNSITYNRIKQQSFARAFSTIALLWDPFPNDKFRRAYRTRLKIFFLWKSLQVEQILLFYTSSQKVRKTPFDESRTFQPSARIYHRSKRTFTWRTAIEEDLPYIQYTQYLTVKYKARKYDIDLNWS